jgi:hypothetical protein
MLCNMVRAHNNLDRAVIAAYGSKGYKNEDQKVADLLDRYTQLLCWETQCNELVEKVATNKTSYENKMECICVHCY